MMCEMNPRYPLVLAAPVTDTYRTVHTSYGPTCKHHWQQMEESQEDALRETETSPGGGNVYTP